MAMSDRVSRYLDDHQVRYCIIPHPHSRSSVGTAISAEVPMHQVAKAVMLESHEGKRLMAIVPADYKISLSKVNDEFHGQFKLIREPMVYQMFEDCDLGAVPPMPKPYHLDAVYDEELMASPFLFMESGDHETLLQVSRDDFVRLMEQYPHTRFSSRAIH